ncbi:MAG: hypothetical protein U0903_17395 [Planctomycetales bacterium]
MHVLGKVFLWLNFLLCLAAFFFTTRMFEIRNSWLKQSAVLEKQYNEGVDKLAQAKNQRANLQADLERTTQPWGSYWTGIKVGINPIGNDQATLTANLGTPQIAQVDVNGTAVNPVLHAFQPVPGKPEMQYVGEFRVENLQPGQSMLVPTRLLRPGEVQRWTAGDNWHFRAYIPNADEALFNSQEIQLMLGLERLNTRHQQLQRLNEMMAQTQKVLKLRVGEIEGFSDLNEKKDVLPPENVQGLLKTIQDEESARNALAADVQKLREELFETQKSFDEIRELNAQLMEQLEKAPKSDKAVTMKTR